MKHLCAVVLTVFATGVASAALRVVADEACPYYAIDIAAFATCDGNVVASETVPVVAAPIQREVPSASAPAPVQVSRSEEPFEPIDRKPPRAPAN